MHMQVNSQTLPGFGKSIYYDEQIQTFHSPIWAPEVEILINTPSAKNLNPKYKTLLVFFATPNGNTIENTIGNTDSVKADWHYDIQHIGAQTRFLREKLKRTNVIVCYLQATQKSWSAWRKSHADSTIRQMIDTVRNLFTDYKTSVVLNGHSGGGNFVFGFINSHQQIPDYVDRIAFLDSNYAYDEGLLHGAKLSNWLKSSTKKALCILAYNDSIALYNGKPFVSPTGGTWYRSKLMADFFKTKFNLKTSSDSSFIRYSALKNRLCIILKTNANKEILHTIQVERNGFIHSMLSGTKLESSGYDYYPIQKPHRAYSAYIQKSNTFSGAQFPERKKKMLSGSAFYKLIDTLSLKSRETLILEQLKKGNFPDFLRNFIPIEYICEGHLVRIEVLPDYLSIGNDDNFVRMPMNPQTAQAFADFANCLLPTKMLVDTIWKRAKIKLNPKTIFPVDRQNEWVSTFLKHNRLIEKQLSQFSQPNRLVLVDGLKKDVVICNKINELPTKVAIYGWYKPDGKPIQPLYTGHVNWYVDYSHGIRLINRLVFIDNKPYYLDEVLKNEQLYHLFSNEANPMISTRYAY